MLSPLVALEQPFWHWSGADQAAMAGLLSWNCAAGDASHDDDDPPVTHDVASGDGARAQLLMMGATAFWHAG
jgi:hypothetical protein